MTNLTCLYTSFPYDWFINMSTTTLDHQTKSTSQKYAFSEEQFAKSNGISICYQTLGNRENPAILLIMGLGVQLVGWHDDFCKKLADKAFFVIRFDNRDVGRSTHFDEAPRTRKRDLIANSLVGRRFSAAYRLEDMADDAVGLLDHLDIAKAHLIGVSMGGMISQVFALNHSDRCLSLTSIMSSTNERDLPRPTAKANRLLLRNRPPEVEQYIDQSVGTFRYFNADTFEFDEAHMRATSMRAWKRDSSATGVARQLAAIMNSGGRRKALRNLQVPALVIHGDADPLVPIGHGVDSAESMPTARLVTVKGMGHSLPRGVWDFIINPFVELANSV